MHTISICLNIWIKCQWFSLFRFSCFVPYKVGYTRFHRAHAFESVSTCPPILSLFKLPRNSSSVIGRGVPGQGLQVECWRWDRPICTSDFSNTLVHFNTAKTKKFWISWIGRCFFCCVFMLHNVVQVTKYIFKSFNLVRERQPLAMAVSEVNKLEDRCEKILRDLDAPLAFKAWHALYHFKFSRKISAKKKYKIQTM